MVDFNKRIYNSIKFSPAAEFFKKHKCYTLAPRGTTDYNAYWEQETDRCLKGYTAPDGDYITGYHYFYLNYSPIMKLEEVKYTDRNGNVRTRRERILDFPRFWDYDYYYYNAIEEAEDQGKHMSVLKSRQRGYEQPYSELIATPNGFVEMGSLKVGDEIWNPDGNTTKVLEIYEQGFKDVYQLELADGRTVRCGANHLWEVICANNHFKHKVYKTHDLLTSGLFNEVTVNGKKYNSYKYYLPPVSPIAYSEKPQNIPAYTLGALLGDGALTKRTPKISSVDKEILDKIQKQLGDGFEFKYDPTTSCEYRIVDKERFLHKSEFKNGQYGVNRLHRWLEELDLCVSCQYKYIPDNYKYGSIEQRYELIRGLMDTDGYISSDGSMSFVNTSKQLVDDFMEVLRSLGIICTVSKRAPGKGGIQNGREIFGTRFSYVVYIKGNPDIFCLSRKRSRIKINRKFSNKVAITNIKYLGEQERQRCILVDNPNHLYVTRDYIPTHNSFKGASMLVRNYELIPGSKNFAVASEQKFLIGDGLLTKAWQIMDFIDKNTEWAKQRLVSTRMERVAGYKVTDEFGKQTEQGYMSSISGITLKNDPERIRGTRGKLVLWEEGGKFPGLLDAWRIEQPSVETDDGVAFGLMVAYGTGGTEGASFTGLKELFYKPEAYNVLAFPNIWDDNAEQTKCGFFVPSWSNLESFDKDGGYVYMDKDGNSLREKAIENLIEQRNKIKDGGASQQSIDRFISERPIKPREAVLELGKNIFPRKLLMDQLTRIRTNTKLRNMKHIVDLNWDGNGQIIATEKKSGDITEYPLKKGDKPHGSVVIWEYPVKDPPFGLYIGGCDPYDHDDSFTNSLGSVFIFKRVKAGEAWNDVIVAEYSGRPDTAEEYYENVRKLLVFYNARLLFENERKGIYPYFTNKHCDYLLADQPDKIISEVFKDSKVQRRKGCHMTKQIRAYGEGLILEWLLEEYEPGHPNVERVYSEPLIEELIENDGVKNVDRVIALCMVMIYREELYQVKVSKSQEQNKQVELFELPLFGTQWFQDNSTQDDIPIFSF